MFPPLSDSTKTFIAVSAVLLVAVCNVVFGIDWVAERPAVRPLAAVTGVTEPPDSRPGSPPMNGNAVAPPVSGATRPNAAAQMNAPAAPAAEAPQPLCDVTACAAAYHSFRASDCTYMPSAGVRRLCTKGTPPQ